MHQVCDTVAELASGTYEELGWPELLPFMFLWVQSNDKRLQESALLVFAQLARHIMGTLRQYMGTLHEVLTRTLASSSQDVALAAMRATSNFVQVPQSTVLPAWFLPAHAGCPSVVQKCTEGPPAYDRVKVFTCYALRASMTCKCPSHPCPACLFRAHAGCLAH